jgi:hypothetical protein
MSAVVVPFPRPQVTKKPAAAKTKAVVAAQSYQKAIREWRPFLDVQEFSVLLEIIDRTAGWNKTAVDVSTDRLLTGDQLYSGVGCHMHRSKMFKALAVLETKGFITRTLNGRGHLIIEFNHKWTPEMLNVPKRLKNQQAGQSPVETVAVSRGDFEVSEGDPVYSNLGMGNPEMGNPLGSPPARPVPNPAERVREAIAKSAAAHRAVVRGKAEAGATSQNSVGIEAAWRAAMIDAFPGSIHKPWSIREKAQVKAQIKSFAAGSGLTFHSLVDWSVRNWSAIIAKQFRWMKQSEPPKVPSLSFLLSFLGQFAECYSEGKLDEWLRAPERTELDKLIATGLTQDEALAEIGKRRAQEGMKEENEKVRVEARSRLRRAEHVEKRTVAIAEAGGTLPVHPQSRAAKIARGEVEAAPRGPMSDEAPEIDTTFTLDPNWEPS